MTAVFDEKTFRLLFRISLFLKAAFSLLEIVGGVLAYFISQQYVLHLVTAITQEELTEDPRDFVVPTREEVCMTNLDMWGRTLFLKINA